MTKIVALRRHRSWVQKSEEKKRGRVRRIRGRKKLVNVTISLKKNLSQILWKVHQERASSFFQCLNNSEVNNHVVICILRIVNSARRPKVNLKMIVHSLNQRRERRVGLVVLQEMKKKHFCRKFQSSSQEYFRESPIIVVRYNDIHCQTEGNIDLVGHSKNSRQKHHCAETETLVRKESWKISTSEFEGIWLSET